jgi:hypothetical protein
MTRFLLSTALCWFAFCCALPLDWADDATPPIKLNFSSYDSMTVPDCLRVMSMETGEIILPDASVSGLVSSINATKDTIPDMLDFLKSYEPGLIYQIVYFPGGGSEPDGEQLYQQIQTMKAFAVPGIILPASGDDNTMLTFRHDDFVTPDAQQKATAGMREIYLVSDPVNRALMKKAAAAPPPVLHQPILPGSQPTAFGTNLSSLVQQIAQMTPLQQETAVIQLRSAERQIYASLDPSVIPNIQAGRIPLHPGALKAPSPTTPVMPPGQ